jgi:hypothetical protein
MQYIEGAPRQLVSLINEDYQPAAAKRLGIHVCIDRAREGKIVDCS